MFKKIFIKENVRNFTTNENDLIVRYNDKKVELNNVCVENILPEVSDVFFIHLGSPFFLFQGKENKILINDKKEKIQIYPKSMIYWDDFICDDSKLKLYSSSFEMNNDFTISYDLKIIDFELGSTIFDIGKKRLLGFYYLISNKLVFSTDENNTQIHAYTLPTAEPLWQFDLENLGEHVSDLGGKYKYEVEKFIGVVGKSLMVLLRQKEILVFDVDTGKITQRLQSSNSFTGETTIEAFQPGEMPFFMTNYFVQEDRGAVYAFFMDILYVISKEGDSFKPNVIGLKSEFEKQGIKANHVSRNTFYSDDRIYFLEQEFGRFGILNVVSKKLEYVSDVIEINGQGVGFDKLKEIQATSDKVYVLDKTNTLHIFQKEHSYSYPQN